MQIEVRVTHPGQWQRALDLPADGLLVGDSACPHKLPDLEELRSARAAAAAAGRSFRLEVPVAFERSFAGLRGLILALAAPEPGLEVVVNDWGILAELRAAARAGAVRLSAGPLLAYSLAGCPWHESIVADEPDHVATGVQVLSLDSPHGCELLTSLGVSGVETDLLPELGPSWCRLAAAGLAVSGRADAVLVSAGRVCHTLRLQGAAPGNCHHLCITPLTLETTHAWQLLDNTQRRLAPAVRRSLPQLELWGNAAYVPLAARPDPAHLTALTRVVLDLRWSGADAVAAWRAIAGLQEGNGT